LHEAAKKILHVSCSELAHNIAVMEPRQPVCRGLFSNNGQQFEKNLTFAGQFG
jgi:hypothetical protein